MEVGVKELTTSRTSLVDRINSRHTILQRKRDRLRIHILTVLIVRISPIRERDSIPRRRIVDIPLPRIPSQIHSAGLRIRRRGVEVGAELRAELLLLRLHLVGRDGPAGFHADGGGGVGGRGGGRRRSR